jgi:hypothetical protein
MNSVIALVFSILILILMQPVSVNAITDIDEKCIKQAYEIGYDLSETIENIMYALTQLEADCVYSGMMSQEAKCLVWYYDTGIRVAHLVLSSPNSPDLADYLTESDRINHECTNLDLLLGRDDPVMNVDLEMIMIFGLFSLR